MGKAVNINKRSREGFGKEDEMQEFKPVKEGKVREVYDNGDSLIIVATDRISAFDHILKNKVTEKGYRFQESYPFSVVFAPHEQIILYAIGIKNLRRCTVLKSGYVFSCKGSGAGYPFCRVFRKSAFLKFSACQGAFTSSKFVVR